MRMRGISRRSQFVRRSLLLLAGLLFGILLVTASQFRAAVPEARIPAEQRLGLLIDRQSKENEARRATVKSLTEQLTSMQKTLPESDYLAQNRTVFTDVMEKVGMNSVKGVGISVTLQDSQLSIAEAGTQNVNNLVIHSGDVQSVLNALWSAGADAVAVNDQRVISTSAVMCVGSTLLVNGTVHSPPFVINAVGVNRDVFLEDEGMQQLLRDAKRYGLRVAVSKSQTLQIPGYEGATLTKYAQVSQ